jgi:hypothetical protein
MIRLNGQINFKELDEWKKQISIPNNLYSVDFDVHGKSYITLVGGTNLKNERRPDVKHVLEFNQSSKSSFSASISYSVVITHSDVLLIELYKRDLKDEIVKIYPNGGWRY